MKMADERSRTQLPNIEIKTSWFMDINIVCRISS